MKFSIYAAAAGISVCLLSNAVHAQGLISHYQFDGNLLNAITAPVGSTQITPGPDGTFYQGVSSAEATPGTANFGPGVDGASSGALRLDGIDDWVNLTTLGQPGSTVEGGGASGPGIYSGTVMAWVRFEQELGSEAHWLMGTKNAAGNQGFQAGWNGTRLETVVSTAGEGEDYILGDATANETWADGSWHHIAYAWDQFGPTAQVYLDGVPLGLAQTPMEPNLNGVNQSAWEYPMAIGARNNEGTLDGFFGGWIDDLRIYAEQVSNGFVENVFNEITPVEDLPVPDFDGSLLVDGNDFLLWQRNFGTGSTFAEGNANAITGDTNIDGADLAIWANGYGAVVAPPSAQAAAVPEPASAALLLLALAAGGAVRSTAYRRIRAQAA